MNEGRLLYHVGLVFNYVATLIKTFNLCTFNKRVCLDFLRGRCGNQSFNEVLNLTGFGYLGKKHLLPHYVGSWSQSYSCGKETSCWDIILFKIGHLGWVLYWLKSLCCWIHLHLISVVHWITTASLLMSSALHSHRVPSVVISLT